MTKTILATRKSPLALVQAELASAWIRKALGHETELLKVVTTGDRQTEWSLEKKGGKGLFTKELEESLKRGEAHVAVHSSKDLPGIMEEGLAIAGYLPREDVRDVLVLRAGIERPVTLATGSPRRRLQAGTLFPDLSFTEIRGNVDTRLKKIAEQHLADGTILAAAGLRRLGIDGWPGLDFHLLPVESMVPAVGQGAIALQVRSDLFSTYAPIFDHATARGLGLERALQNALGAGCQTAFAAHVSGDSLFFFHQDVGLRSVPLAPADLDDPASTARTILGQFGLHAA
jgi:hydroxymethylbilane synthase